MAKGYFENAKPRIIAAHGHSSKINFIHHVNHTPREVTMVVFKTNYGSISIELDFDKAPVSAANFLQYARDGFYNNTIFHRVIDDFMVQGGGFESGMTEKPKGEPIANEANNGLPNLTGTVAMARTPDPHSASSQFFINVSDNHFLNHRIESAQGWGYAVFGKIVDGMDVVNKMKQVETSSQNGHQDVPVTEIIIESTEIVGEAE